jgi:hypothetical protein
MAYEQITVSVQNYRLQALREVAEREDVSVGQVIRDAIDRDLRRREKAKRDGRTDEALVAPLRSLLADELAFAQDWQDLQTKLAAKGYALQEAGGGLILVSLPSRERLCKASELGYSHTRLARRFGTPFPNHANAPQIRRQIAS